MSALAVAAGPVTPGVPSSGADVAIRLEGLTKRFPLRRGWRGMLRCPTRAEHVPVLRDVTCAVGAGEFFGLLGPNGAGKTTLFKILATLVLPDEGTAAVEGYDVVREAAAVRRILAPVIADERSLHWRLSARENLRLYARLQDLRGTAARTRIGEVLDIVELVATGEKLVGAFSSGMRQRLLIARALLARPRVLLLDEPTRSLDPLSARTFRAFLRQEVSSRQRCTVVLATHNAEEALELCGRVAVLDRGRLLAVGAAADLAREVGDDEYRLWTRNPEHACLGALAKSGVVRQMVAQPADAQGWACVGLQVPGGADEAATVLGRLARSGMSIARFERVGVSLADLIGRIVERRRGEPADG